MYSCDMSGINIHSFIDGLVSNENSPFNALLKSNSIYDLGCSSGTESHGRMYRKMGLYESNCATNLFARRIESLEYMQGVQIHLKNVAPVGGVEASKIVEEYLHEKISHKHYGICLAVPTYFGKGLFVKKDEFGNEGMILYLIGANPLSNFFYKQDLRKGRSAKEKESALLQEVQQALLSEQVAKQGEDIRELKNSNTELKNMMGFVASQYGYGENEEADCDW